MSPTSFGIERDSPPARESWVRDEIHARNGKWIVAYRIVPKGGLPVIAEVRVYPAVGDSRFRPAGWADDLTAEEAASLVPPGGLPIKVLRAVTRATATKAWRRHRFDPVGVVVSYAGQPFFKMRASLPGGTLPLADLLTPVLSEIGFSPEEQESLKVRRPGRRGRPPAFYAKVVAAYLKAASRGDRSPNKAVAEALGVTAKQVDGWLIEARRGSNTRPPILTHPPIPGLPGGELTEYGLSLLKENE